MDTLKVFESNNKAAKQFKNLKSGEVFKTSSEHLNHIYMKLNKVINEYEISCNAVDLENYGLVYFTDDIEVIPLEAKLEVYNG